MCFGLPVVATAVFGLPELLDDGTTGFLYAPNDIDALTSAMRRVLSSPAHELNQVGDAGRALVLDRYDSRGYATSIRRLMESLLKDGSAPTAETLGLWGDER
jgi:glycosyltransferase involved in cell wall biosynthesis